MLHKRVPETIDEYCTNLRGKLRGVLPEEKIEEAVSEAKSHLQESAAALSRQEPDREKEALARFVSPGKLAGGLIKAWAPLYLRHGGTTLFQNISVGLCLCVNISWLALILGARLPVPLLACLNVLWEPWTLQAVIFCLAILACRSQSRRFTQGALGVLVACVLLTGWLCTFAKGELISRLSASERLKVEQARSTVRQKEKELLLQGEAFYSPYWNSPTYIAREANLQKLKELLYRKYTLLLQHKSESELNEVRSVIAAVELEKAVHDATLKQSLQNIPEMLRVGDRYLIPIKANRGDYAFQLVETVDSLDKALERWHEALPYYRRINERWLNYHKSVATTCKTLMTSSLWSFDMRSAGYCVFNMVIMAGKLIIADLLGGCVGGWILRLWRRRRGGSGMRLKQ